MEIWGNTSTVRGGDDWEFCSINPKPSFFKTQSPVEEVWEDAQVFLPGSTNRAGNACWLGYVLPTQASGSMPAGQAQLLIVGDRLPQAMPIMNGTSVRHRCGHQCRPWGFLICTKCVGGTALVAVLTVTLWWIPPGRFGLGSGHPGWFLGLQWAALRSAKP